MFFLQNIHDIIKPPHDVSLCLLPHDIMYMSARPQIHILSGFKEKVALAWDRVVDTDFCMCIIYMLQIP